MIFVILKTPFALLILEEIKTEVNHNNSMPETMDYYKIFGKAKKVQIRISKKYIEQACSQNRSGFRRK